jgi:hypothetical protein
MYLNNNKEFPNKAKRYILLAGISIAINVIFRLLYTNIYVPIEQKKNTLIHTHRKENRLS